MWRSRLGPTFPTRSGSVLEAPAIVAGLKNVAVMGQTVEECGGQVQSHPFGYRRLGGIWGHYRPSPALLELGHHQTGMPMCNLYSNLTTQEAMRQLFNAKDRLGNQPPLPGIFPDAQVPIVRINRDGETELTHARWGWNKAKFGWVTNVRKLDGWPWKHVIEETRQRCLVPASSFAEYHPTETIPGASGKPIKAATWFRLVGDEPRPPFAFAGFMRRWNWEKDGLRKKADEPLRGSDTQVIAMAFLTTEPNAVVEPIHPKAMPVILQPAQFETWLHADAAEAANLQRPFADELLEIVFTGAKEDRGA